jgi:hypothetical protein
VKQVLAPKPLPEKKLSRKNRYSANYCNSEKLNDHDIRIARGKLIVELDFGRRGKFRVGLAEK